MWSSEDLPISIQQSAKIMAIVFMSIQVSVPMSEVVPMSDIGLLYAVFKMPFRCLFSIADQIHTLFLPSPHPPILPNINTSHYGDIYENVTQVDKSSYIYDDLEINV